MEYLIQVTAHVLKGCGLTLQLFSVTALFSFPLAVIFAVGAVSGSSFLRRSLTVYAWIFRGTPLLLQLFFFYYGLSIFNISLKPFTAASLTFVLNYAAYLMEIVRAGILSVDRGQSEASRALNMNRYQTMSRIILPQALRRSLPPLCNEAITLVKDTALVVVIGMGEILRSAKEIFTRDFSVIPFLVAAVIYLLLTSVIILGFRKLEEKWELSQ